MIKIVQVSVTLKFITVQSSSSDSRFDEASLLSCRFSRDKARLCLYLYLVPVRVTIPLAIRVRVASSIDATVIVIEIEVLEARSNCLVTYLLKYFYDIINITESDKHSR